jgi:hypothetical protein
VSFIPAAFGLLGTKIAKMFAVSLCNDLSACNTSRVDEKVLIIGEF